MSVTAVGTAGAVGTPPVPVPAAGTCEVWLVPVRRRAAWAALLDADERERWEALGEGPAADTLLTSRAAQRLIVSRYCGLPPNSLSIERSCGLCGAPRHGRPRLPGAAFDFSVSHTRDWLLLAVVGTGLVGADLDHLDPDRDTDGLAALTLTPTERRAYDQLPSAERPVAFLDSWVRKEAAIKLTGHGLAAPPAAIDTSGPVVQAPSVPNWPAAPVHVTPLPAPDGHRAALATTTPVTRLRSRAL
ncbi:4'-phosphopantetheinyl transferase superfamily protein [Streptomyces sp. NPDC051976]|uniref:4'-phosphopantetheinyl transferase family protein n=1 Tax=Streptomyces sp. NPDC051976 TaxID=3154947 RepID=UPI0034362657